MTRGGGGGLAAGAAAPLSYGEERNAFGNATARGPLAGFPFFSIRHVVGAREKLQENFEFGVNTHGFL